MSRSNIFLFTLLFAFVSALPVARADDQDSSSQTTQAPPTKAKKKKKKKKKAASTSTDTSTSAHQSPDGTPPMTDATPVPTISDRAYPNAAPTTAPAQGAASSEDHNNNREKTLEGSKSPVSGQFNLTYNGSSINHPFSQLAPNPGNDVPPPVVTLAGTVSARYRIDKKTTVGLGTGLTGQSPFQNSHWTVANPYTDIARSFKVSGINNRADFSFTLYTDNEYNNQYGYREGLSLSDEIFYEWSFGLTTGVAFEIDANFFSSQAQYDPALQGPNQASWDIYPEPYFEYQLSKRVNLRSVVGVGWNHTRDLSSFMVLKGPRVYETFGVGVAAADWAFLYFYLKAYPYSGTLGVKTTTAGVNAIINLF